uniref:Uncharacterized protein n=1 Tax=Oryza punctata TaxID=4537 RepID=A0A0E0JZ39_ORYPU
MVDVMKCPNNSFTSATERSSDNIEVHALMVVGYLEGRSNHGIRAAGLMPTRCSTECSSIDVEPDLSVAVVVTCTTTATSSVELVVAEDTIGATYIDNPKQPKVTLFMCLKNCSSPDAILDSTETAKVTCISISMASMELEVGEDVTCTTGINVPHRPMETHTKCSMLGLDVRCDADQAVIAFLTMTGGSRVVPTSMKPVDIFSPRAMVDPKQDTNMPCLLKCPDGGKRELMEHPKRNPWPPPTHN